MKGKLLETFSCKISKWLYKFIPFLLTCDTCLSQLYRIFIAKFLQLKLHWCKTCVHSGWLPNFSSKIIGDSVSIWFGTSFCMKYVLVNCYLSNMSGCHLQKILGVSHDLERFSQLKAELSMRQPLSLMGDWCLQILAQDVSALILILYFFIFHVKISMNLLEDSGACSFKLLQPLPAPRNDHNLVLKTAGTIKECWSWFMYLVYRRFCCIHVAWAFNKRLFRCLTDLTEHVSLFVFPKHVSIIRLGLLFKFFY